MKIAIRRADTIRYVSFISYNMLNSLTDPAGNHRIVHGIQVNSIGIVCQQINDLTQCIGHSGIKQCFFIILEFVDNLLETLRERSSAHRLQGAMPLSQLFEVLFDSSVVVKYPIF